MLGNSGYNGLGERSHDAAAKLSCPDPVAGALVR